MSGLWRAICDWAADIFRHGRKCAFCGLRKTARRFQRVERGYWWCSRCPYYFHVEVWDDVE
jgi:ribosomal protein L37AE/L43A